MKKRGGQSEDKLKVVFKCRFNWKGTWLDERKFTGSSNRREKTKNVIRDNLGMYIKDEKQLMYGVLKGHEVKELWGETTKYTLM